MKKVLSLLALLVCLYEAQAQPSPDTSGTLVAQKELVIKESTIIKIENIGSQEEWLNSVKSNGSMTCHALGTKATRTMPKDFTHFELPPKNRLPGGGV